MPFNTARTCTAGYCSSTCCTPGWPTLQLHWRVSRPSGCR
jgi:hypothetical protein